MTAFLLGVLVGILGTALYVDYKLKWGFWYEEDEYPQKKDEE